MKLSLANTKNGIRAVGLRNQKLRRVQQIAVINAEFAANRGFDSDA